MTYRDYVAQTRDQVHTAWELLHPVLLEFRKVHCDGDLIDGVVYLTFRSSVRLVRLTASQSDRNGSNPSNPSRSKRPLLCNQHEHSHSLSCFSSFSNSKLHGKVPLR